MLRNVLIPVLCSLLLAAEATSSAHAECKLNKLVDVPVIMFGSQPLVIAKVNGVEARFLADSGATYSVLGLGTGMALHVDPHLSHLIDLPTSDGRTKAFVVTANSFEFAG